MRRPSTGPTASWLAFLRGETPGTSRLGCGLGGGRGQPALERGRADDDDDDSDVDSTPTKPCRQNRTLVTPGIAARAGGSQCEKSSKRSAAAPAAPKAGALAACDRGEHGSDSVAITAQQALVKKRAFQTELADIICTFKASCFFVLARHPPESPGQPRATQDSRGPSPGLPRAPHDGPWGPWGAWGALGRP